MANVRIFRFSRLTDRQIIDLFLEFEAEFEDVHSNLTFLSNLNLQTPNLDRQNVGRSSHAISNGMARIKPDALSIYFQRGISGKTFAERTPSAYFDEIQIQISNQQLQTAKLPDYLKLVEIVEKHCVIADLEGSENEAKSKTDLLNANLQKLAELATELTIGADTKRRELDSKRDELQKAYEAKELALEQDHQQAEEKLSKKRESLELIKSELDDREHKHVRRSLRETITNDLQTQIERPQSSRNARVYNSAAMYIAIVVGVLAGYFAYLTQQTIPNIAMDVIYDPETGLKIGAKPATSLPVYILYIKLFVSSATSLGLFIYVITWLRTLARDDIEYQRRLERYVFDMNRASWTIETILELSDTELNEIPQSWLDSVTKNLFENENSVPEDHSSLQSLAALLNITSEAEIGPEGPKFKLNKKAVKKAASQID